MEATRALELLGTFTAEQWGMVTFRQARSLGLDGITLHRLEKSGNLDRIRHGVYAATSAVVTEARDEQAAWLALNPAVPAWERPPVDPDGGVLSHQSAARLYGLGELIHDRIAFTTPRRRTSRDPDLWFKTAVLTDADVTTIDGLPVTTALRTIGDLLDQHIDGSHIATIIQQAVLANLVRLDELADHIGPYALRYGIRRAGDGEALLEHLLAEIGTSTTELAHRPAPPRTANIDALARHLTGVTTPVAQYLAQIDTAGISRLPPEVLRQLQGSTAASVLPAIAAAAQAGSPLAGIRHALGKDTERLAANLAGLGLPQLSILPTDLVTQLANSRHGTLSDSTPADDGPPGTDDDVDTEHDDAHDTAATAEPPRVSPLAKGPSSTRGKGHRRYGR
ncbi:type IV toxin-antitoxin system AbiEi family antitoxin domain-containing protein [Amycolatopsis sp. NPDC058986]|uniref:type IV toxin-antitoxin system AbiEi family antitoxin domain-containing protein n=1 Tax=unclassified Amycolatopsis TaxID=2618356 RepID=UPI00366BF6FD